MKNVFIGLLIVAAGAGLYYFFIRKKAVEPAVQVNQALLPGKWKTSSYVPVKDSTQPYYQYDFLKEGLSLRTVTDSSKADSLHYTWNKTGQLEMKAGSKDSTAAVYAVEKLYTDSLQIKTADSVLITLTRVK